MFREQLNFDGLWLDMNEFSNFCDGQCGDKDESTNINPQNDMIYVPGGRDLEYKSLPLWAKHASKDKDLKITEYDAHSLNGFF